jgi:hypothetical protein
MSVLTPAHGGCACAYKRVDMIYMYAYHGYVCGSGTNTLNRVCGKLGTVAVRNCAPHTHFFGRLFSSELMSMGREARGNLAMYIRYDDAHEPASPPHARTGYLNQNALKYATS